MSLFKQFWISESFEQWITPEKGCAFFLEKMIQSNALPILSLNIIDIDTPFQKKGRFTSYLQQLLEDCLTLSSCGGLQIQHVVNSNLARFLSKIPQVQVIFDPTMDIGPTFLLQKKSIPSALSFLQEITQEPTPYTRVDPANPSLPLHRFCATT